MTACTNADNSSSLEERSRPHPGLPSGQAGVRNRCCSSPLLDRKPAGRALSPSAGNDNAKKDVTAARKASASGQDLRTANKEPTHQGLQPRCQLK